MVVPFTSILDERAGTGHLRAGTGSCPCCPQGQSYRLCTWNVRAHQSPPLTLMMPANLRSCMVSRRANAEISWPFDYDLQTCQHWHGHYSIVVYILGSMLERTNGRDRNGYLPPAHRVLLFHIVFSFGPCFLLTATRCLDTSLRVIDKTWRGNQSLKVETDKRRRPWSRSSRAIKIGNSYRVLPVTYSRDSCQWTDCITTGGIQIRVSFTWNSKASDEISLPTIREGIPMLSFFN